MKKRIIAVWILLCAIAGARSGTITGMVRAHGKEGAEASASSGGKYESRQFKFVERVNYAELRDFVVYIVGPVGSKVSVPEKPAQVRSILPELVILRHLLSLTPRQSLAATW